MTAVGLLQEEIAKIGYSAIVSNYVFADVFAASPVSRKAPIAAFTYTPPSYRNAALAVVEAHQRPAIDVVSEYRALGAPVLFVVEGDDVTVWQVRADTAPRAIARAHQNELPELFSAHRATWNPQSIQRAKSIGQFNRQEQLDFVDLGLLPAIEGETHAKLDILLNEALAEAINPKTNRPRGVGERLLFRAVFRFLAAKILQDRSHSLASAWDPNNIETVLGAISRYYKLPALLLQPRSVERTVLGLVWERLQRGINFQNISADDLAFVYENTLVTPEIREALGTHSTPWAVADYVVGRLEFWRHNPNEIYVYEPFAGAGVFMVAALRHLREVMPVSLTDRQRHEHLVQHVTGDEIDQFAKEVSTLSLILADYPNANGWAISEIDLFEGYRIAERARAGNIILCNPPFEPFTQDERLRYPQAATHSASKPIAVLDAVLDASPIGIGFVLPEPFIKGTQYQTQRRRIERMYKDIELVSLPDRTFRHSVIRSSLLIARERREEKKTVTSLRSTVVTVRDRDRFLRSGEVSNTRVMVRPFAQDTGDLWINELEAVWESLAKHPTFGSLAFVHRGIEWQGGQTDAVRSSPQKGFVRGIHAANAVRPFLVQNVVYLDCRPHRLRARAIDRPWSKPKILANAARLSRGPWCLAAAVDNNGLIASQQVFGVWPKSGARLYALSALLNNPLANAYVASHSPADRIRVASVLSIPVPTKIPVELDELVKRYMHIVAEGDGLFSNKNTKRPDVLLNQIDALVLRAYDLSPRLERQLLEYFRDAERPTLHEWSHWLPIGFRPFIPLYEYLSKDYQEATGNWISTVFRPLPEAEAAALREYLD